MEFRYEAANADGQLLRGQLSADSERALLQLLQDEADVAVQLLVGQLAHQRRVLVRQRGGQVEIVVHGVGADLLGRRVLLTLTAGPRTGASGVVDVYEGRNARADLRIGRLPVEEVACAPLRSTGQH